MVGAAPAFRTARVSFQPPTNRPDMTPDPDAPPEAAAPLPALPERELRVVEAAVAGVAGLLIGRALLGRAGGLATGLAALGAGLLGKRPPPAEPKAPPAEPQANGSGHAPPSAPAMKVRLQTSPVPPVDAVAALAAAAACAPLALAAAPAGEEHILLPPDAAAEPSAAAAPDAWPAPEPVPAGGFIQQAAQAAAARLAELALAPAAPPAAAAESAEDAGAFAEMPALFEPVSAPAAISAPAAGLPVSAFLEQAASELELASFPDLTPPPATTDAAPAAPQTGPGPSARTAPVPSLLEDFPVEFTEWKEEEEPGLREEFLLIPEEAPRPLPPLEPVVAALGESLALTEPEAVPAPPAAELPGLTPPPETAVAEVTAAVTAAVQEILEVLPVEAALPGAATAPVAPDISRAAAGVPEPPVLAEAVPVVAPAPAPRPATAPVRPIPLAPPALLTEPPPPAFPGLAAETPRAATPPPPDALPETAAVELLPAPVRPIPVTPPDAPEPGAAPVPGESPFRIWQEPAAPEPVPDPDEIWRQAAAELAALRPPPAPSPITASVFPVPVPAPVVPAQVLPPEATPAAAPQTALIPPWLSELPAKPSTGTAPPWMQNMTPVPVKAEPRPFLPTIRLAVPREPQPLAARMPHAAPESPSPAAPVTLPGYRAAPVPSDSPAEPKPAAPPPVAEAPPPAAAPVLPAAPPAAPDVPVLTATPPPEKIYVDRDPVRRAAAAPAPGKPLVTPARVGVLAVLAAILLIFAFAPQLQRFWDEKILGRTVKPAPRAAAPDKPAVPGEAADVRIVEDSNDPAPAVPGSASSPAPAPPPPAPEPAPSPEPEPAPPPEEPGTVTTGPTDTEPLPVPPPPAEDKPEAPLSVDEAGARELIGRLLNATSASGVQPYILEAEKLGPALDAYFNSGKAVPVATHACVLDRSDKIPGTGRMSWFFKVTTDTITTGFPVIVEETAAGLRADWELLSQCRDGALRKFTADATAPPGVFYAGLQRRHSFPDMLPGKDHTKYLAFAISSPVLLEPASYAFIPRSAPHAARAEALYKFGSVPHAPVLELTHKDGHVEITGILRENWRMAGKR